jgi:hypothetical protein
MKNNKIVALKNKLTKLQQDHGLLSLKAVPEAKVACKL